MRKRKQRRPNAEYSLPTKSGLRPGTKRLLALDPGSRNMGISAIAVNELGVVRVMANSIVTNTIHDLTQFGPQRDLFLAEIDRWISLYQPDGIIAERFQTRGIGGPLIEQVSVMLGLLGGCYRLPTKLITAATWKNAFHRRFEHATLDELYKKSRTTPHQLDACMIGIYGLELGMGTFFKWDPMEIVRMAEDTSCVRLINKRGV